MLLAIAIAPLALPRWWERNLHKLLVSCLLSLPVLLHYVGTHPGALIEVGEKFLSFIILLASLYIVSGGILLAGDLRATPQINTAFLAAGTILASLIGTTGASLLLIRPLLKTNQERLHKVHTVIFFIFLVSNIGGCLTPLGDPPLFLGYLEGVPFLWTLRIAPIWLATGGALLVIYFVWDTIMFTREPIFALERDKLLVRPMRILGTQNFALLAGIILSVAFLSAPWREAAMILIAALSLWVTPQELRQANHFTYHPILEVTALFLGIFLTMTPTLEILRMRGSAMGIQEPWQFFWITGGLSSFLDNAPTYLVFLNLARGLGLPNEVAGVSHEVLQAISLGAVFMGANTYIGNAPNFMVKSVAEERGVKMPSFFGYVLYSGSVLIPVFIALTLFYL
jgi:Na+/H+ antiporter NhaD/arsenite permease-like protein